MTVETDLETFAERLRRLRLANNLSQRELHQPGVSYAYISRLEAGQRVPSLKAIRKLAAKLGVTPLYLELGNVEVCPCCYYRQRSFPFVPEVD